MRKAIQLCAFLLELFRQTGDVQILCVVVTLQPLKFAPVILKIGRLRRRNSRLAAFDDAIAGFDVQVIAVDRFLCLPLTVLGVAQSVRRVFRELPSLPNAIVSAPTPERTNSK